MQPSIIIMEPIPEMTSDLSALGFEPNPNIDEWLKLIHREIPAKPITEEPIGEEPITEEPTTEEPTTEEPITEEPITEEPTTEETITEERTTEQPITGMKNQMIKYDVCIVYPRIQNSRKSRLKMWTHTILGIKASTNSSLAND